MRFPIKDKFGVSVSREEYLSMTIKEKRSRGFYTDPSTVYETFTENLQELGKTFISKDDFSIDNYVPISTKKFGCADYNMGGYFEGVKASSGPSLPQITISGPNSIKVGETAQLVTNVTGVRAYYSSSKDDVLDVDGKGVIMGVKAGSATVTVKAEGYRSGSKTISVSSSTFTVTGDTEVEVGSSILLTSSVIDTQWKSSNTSVATVEGGQVSGIKAGTAVITAYKTGYSDVKITITVKEATGSINAYFGVIALTEDEFEVFDTEAVSQKLARLTESVVKSGEKRVISNVAGTYTINGAQNDGIYYYYPFYAFPTSAGTIKQVEDPAFPGAPNNAWKSGTLTIDGVQHTVWMDTESNCISPITVVFTA